MRICFQLDRNENVRIEMHGQSELIVIVSEDCKKCTSNLVRKNFSLFLFLSLSLSYKIFDSFIVEFNFSQSLVFKFLSLEMSRCD